MGNNKIIGAKIKSIRESKQLSTQEVSERSGLSIEQIERIEGNIDFPSLAPLIKIARVLGVRLAHSWTISPNWAPSFAARKIAMTRTASVSATTTARHASTWNTIRCHKTSRAAIWNRS